MEISKPDVYIINSPAALCFHEPEYFDGTLDFFLALEKIPKHVDTKITINFSGLEELTGAAATYLFALVTSQQFYINNNMFSFKLPKSKVMKGKFEYTGLSSALKKGGRKKLSSLWSNSSFVCGGQEDVPKFLKVLRDRAKLDTLPSKLGAAVRETCLNVYHHAYGGPSRLVDVQWWAYFYIIEQGNERYIDAVIVDRGMGIPNSIKNAFPLYVRQYDFECIKYAMTKNVTSTKEPGRGKGSENIKKPILINNLDGRDRLMVMSGSAIYTFYNDETQQKNVIETEEFPEKFHGTIVQWRLYF